MRGSARPALVALLSLSIISTGVFLGAPTPCKGRDGALDLADVADGCLDRLNVKGGSRGLNRLPEQMSERSRLRVEDERHTGDRRRDMFERLQPLAADGELETSEPGERAARAGEIRHEAAADRIGHLNEYDRQGVVLPQRRQHWRAGGEDQVRREADQLGCLLAQEGGVASRPAVLQAKVTPVGPAQFPQPGLKRFDPQLRFRIARRHGQKYTDQPRAITLLRTRPEGPCRRTAKQPDEIPPPHVGHGDIPPLPLATRQSVRPDSRRLSLP